VSTGASSDIEPALSKDGGGTAQRIEPDTCTNPRIWDTYSSRILNITILDANVFRTLTGVSPPPTPISEETYRDMGLPFDDAWKDNTLQLRNLGIESEQGDCNETLPSADCQPLELIAPNASIPKFMSIARLSQGEDSALQPWDTPPTPEDYWSPCMCRCLQFPTLLLIVCRRW
jgi:hypothetical protein